MTAQAPDWIIRDGERVRLGNWPWPFPPTFRLPDRWRFHSSWTANARGYTATWWIVADSLFLKSVGGTVAIPDRKRPVAVSMRQLLGTDAPVFADWFTGSFYTAISDPAGATDDPASRFAEEDWEIVVVGGRVVAEGRASNAGHPPRRRTARP